MKEYQDSKDWASQYHPTGLLNRRMDSPLAKGLLTIFKAACMAMAFAGAFGAIWWVFRETYTLIYLVFGSLFVGPLGFFIWLLISGRRSGTRPSGKKALMFFVPYILIFVGFLALEYWYFIPREGI